MHFPGRENGRWKGMEREAGWCVGEQQELGKPGKHRTKKKGVGAAEEVCQSFTCQAVE